jgi:hypothetical protein
MKITAASPKYILRQGHEIGVSEDGIYIGTGTRQLIYTGIASIALITGVFLPGSFLWYWIAGFILAMILTYGVKKSSGTTYYPKDQIKKINSSFSDEGRILTTTFQFKDGEWIQGNCPMNIIGKAIYITVSGFTQKKNRTLSS